MKSRTSIENNNVGGKVFGIFWIGFSSIFFFIGCWVIWTSLKENRWKEVPVQVSEFKIKAQRKLDPPFQAQTKYTYQWEGQSYTGTKVYTQEKGTEEYEELGRLEYEIRVEDLKTCFVNPDNPSEAALIMQSKAGLIFGAAFALFGALFISIGVSIFRVPAESASLSEHADEDSEGGGLGGKLIGIMFFSLFALAGTGAAVYMVNNLMTAKASQGWDETKASVIWSRIVSDDDTSKLKVFYQYNYRGTQYRSNTVSSFESSSSGNKGGLLKEYPRKKKTVCYVNPDAPWQAVLKNELGWGWLWALFPIPFLLVGYGGLFAICFLDKSPFGKKTSRKEELKKEALFQPGNKRLMAVIGSIFIALFWNGIVSVFLFQVYKSWSSGSQDWFLTLFMIPFTLVGIGLIIHIFYRILALFNPKPMVMLSPGYLTIGQSADLAWKIPSGGHKMNRFTVTLIGDEEAEYKRGTNTSKDTSCFYEEVLVDETTLRNSAQGVAQVTLPKEGVVPSWQGKHNAIHWKLIITGEIPKFPDLTEKYDITVINPLTDKVS